MYPRRFTCSRQQLLLCDYTYEQHCFCSGLLDYMELFYQQTCNYSLYLTTSYFLCETRTHDLHITARHCTNETTQKLPPHHGGPCRKHTQTFNIDRTDLFGTLACSGSLQLRYSTSNCPAIHCAHPLQTVSLS